MTQDLIDRCNQFLWKYLYPEGNRLDIGSHQHRDLVRTFFAGVVETLMQVSMWDEINGLMPFYEEITKEGWMPDDRFIPARLWRRGEAGCN